MGVARYSTSYFQLLTRANPKLVKGLKRGYASFILHLAPADLSGYEMCQWRTKECTFLCLNRAGRAGIELANGSLTNVSQMIQSARIRRTKLFVEDRETFLQLLIADIERAVRYAKRRALVPCLRLNGTSDVVWEAIHVQRNGKAFDNVFAAFPRLQFYDYTKAPWNRRAHGIRNYHLTFSLAETIANKRNADKWLTNGANIAAVFSRELPETFNGGKVFDGDKSDLRFIDPKGVIVGLIAKGRRAKRMKTNGFIHF